MSNTNRKNEALSCSADLAFTEDITSLFLQEKHGHMGRWEYEDSSFSEDPAGGLQQWERLVESPGCYYPVLDEVALIHHACSSEKLVSVLSSVETAYELGPGGRTPIIRKTVPFLRLCRSLECYVAVDISVLHAKSAAQQVLEQLSVKTETRIEDYTSIMNASDGSKSTVSIMWGLSLGNLPGRIGENPFLKLVHVLSCLGKSFGRGDLLIFTFDTEMNREKVINAYREEANKDGILSPLYRMKRDGYVSGNFEPDVWRYEPFWNAKAKQCAHTVRPVQDQMLNINGTNIFVPAGKKFVMNNSYKYSTVTVESAARNAGIVPLCTLQHKSMAMFAGRV